MQIVSYEPALSKVWNDLVLFSRNATFLLDRRFMDYHSDRFTDVSLLFYRGKRLLGLLPASAHGTSVVSHGGLTYGGFVLAADAHAQDVGEMLEAAAEYYRARGFNELTIKPIPAIYHSYPSDDELYWLYRHGARLTARGLSSAIRFDVAIPFSTLRMRKVQTARAAGLMVEETADATDFHEYWEVLTEVLQKRHQHRPVHTIDEILRLRDSFPENIVLFVVRRPRDRKIVGGTLLFLTLEVAHAQYIAASDEGRETGALDLLFYHVIGDLRESSMHYLDFGISTEDAGRYLNEGLNFQKEGYGARSVVYDAYTVGL
ncbi:MAG: GNAT family N-acetyltransferase [Bacteroidales bacterium]|nr:GNAT family N-acetyltransferase [Bacteroidales bacterium]